MVDMPSKQVSPNRIATELYNGQRDMLPPPHHLMRLIQEAFLLIFKSRLMVYRPIALKVLTATGT